MRKTANSSKGESETAVATAAWNGGPLRSSFCITDAEWLHCEVTFMKRILLAWSLLRTVLLGMMTNGEPPFDLTLVSILAALGAAA